MKRFWCDFSATFELVVQQIGMMKTEKQAIQRREQHLSDCYLQTFIVGPKWGKVTDRVGPLPPWLLCWSKYSISPTKLCCMGRRSETKNFCPWPSDTWKVYCYYVKGTSNAEKWAACKEHQSSWTILFTSTAGYILVLKPLHCIKERCFKHI